MAFKCLGLFWMVFCWGILRIKLVTASTKVIRIGDDLLLNCASQVGSNQTWWFEGKSLANNTMHTNNFDILQISNVDKKNQGMYWCGPSWQQGMNVSVFVGNLPSPPRNLYTTSYEFNKFLHWTSANYTGGLPTHYSVHIHCTDMPNCSRELTGVLYVPEVISDCDSVKHVDGKNYNCSLQSANMFFGYRATVFAVNELGNSSASVFFHRPIQIHPDTTPAKPVQLTATEVQPGKVRLTWKTKGETFREITFYRIVYREKGIENNNNNNKTWLKDTQDTTVVINNLNGDTTYTFYVWKQFRAINVSSPLSTPAVTTLHTKTADPDQPPQDLQCSTIKENSSVIITDVSWKAPSKKHHNGPLLFYKISSSTLGSYNKTKFVNATQTSVNLTFAKPHKTIQIYSTACNEHGCSGISNSCTIKGQFDSKRQIPHPSNKILIIVGAVCGAAVCATIVHFIGFCCYLRNKKATNTTEGSNLLDLEIDMRSYDHMYDEPKNIEDNDDYDRPRYIATA